jgi:anti-anti-sigma regulatory factor
VLKITINETPTEERWILQGSLVGPWVDELRTSWKETRRSHGGRTCVVDLNDVSFIDKCGEKLLRTMSKHGAKLVADGMYIRHVLEQLKTSGARRLTALIVCLFAGLQVNAIVPVTRGQVRPARMELRVKESSGLRFNAAKPWSWLAASSLNVRNSRNGTMSVAVMSVIGGTDAMSPLADRTTRTEDQ